MFTYIWLLHGEILGGVEELAAVVLAHRVRVTLSHVHIIGTQPLLNSTSNPDIS
jgi:hypothetical protein